MAKNAAEAIRDERNWLVQILTDPGRVGITDVGLDLTEDPPVGELVYDVPYGRFEIRIRQLRGDSEAVSGAETQPTQPPQLLPQPRQPL